MSSRKNRKSKRDASPGSQGDESKSAASTGTGSIGTGSPGTGSNEAVEADGTEKKPPTAWSRIRENAEAIVVAIILALIIRHFSLEAFEIPTGSMAPGLHGVHIETECPNCETVDNIGIGTYQQTERDRNGRVHVAGEPNVPWRNLLIYEGTCPECSCPIEAHAPAVGPSVHCPGCREARPADPDGFRSPERGFNLISAFKQIRRRNLLLIIGLIFVATLLRAPAARLIAGGLAVAALAFTLVGYGKNLEPKVASIQNTCRECGLSYREIFEPGDCLGGHKILVNKFLYQLRDPQRWEVIVFKFNRQRNYIKRLTGLPGERIQVIEGDIWIAPDHQSPLAVKPKPEWAQDELWFPVHDSDVNERGLMPLTAWDKAGGWVDSRDGTGLEFNALESPASMRYQRPITNANPYNNGGRDSARNTRAFDLRVETEVTFGGGAGTWELQVVNGERIFRCVLPISGGASADPPEPTGLLISQPASSGQGVETTVLAPLDEVEIQRDTRHLIDFYRADRHLVLRVDGTIVAEVPIPNGVASNLPHDANRVAVDARGLGGTLHRVRVFRDIHYTGSETSSLPHATVEPYDIPADGYFAMGDNSASSLDSRAWGALAGQNLLGRAFAIFWPGLPGRWEIGFIR